MAIELEHSFAVPVPPDQAWDVLLDVQRVAPCMPGATVDSVDGDEVTGKIKVKVGPIALTYAGTATFTERDPVARSVRLQAAGKETKGAGTATATVVARLDEDNGQTRVNVHTSLNVTGRPAQFGRGVMAEVSGKIIEKFSANLAGQLASGAGTGAGAATGTAAATGAGAGTEAGAGAEDGAGSGAGAGAGGGAAGAPAPDSRMAIPIQELNLPARSVNTLKGEGIATVGELVARTEGDLLSIKNLGAKSVGEIEQRLGDLGLALAGPGSGTGGPGSAEAGPAASNGSTAGTGAGAAGQAAAGPSGGAAGAGAAWDGQPAAWRADQDAAARDEDDDSLNLLDAAAGPILKRALPAAAALGALIWVGLRLRGRGRRAAGD